MSSVGLQPESRETARALLLLAAFFVVLTTGAYLYSMAWSGSIPRDGTTLVMGRDFLNLWMYGRAAWLDDPGSWYDPARYNPALEAIVGANYPGQNWTNPPSLILVMAPFGLLGYLPALLVWTVSSLILFLAVGRRHFADKRLLLAVVLSPAAVLCVISGQTSLITTIMLVTIFAWLDRRPVPAGILIGLLSLKPQLGILFPIALIASARWRVFASAAVTTLALAAAAALIFGQQMWIDFVVKAIPMQNLVLIDPDRIATPFHPTIFMNLRGADLPYNLAMAVQLCFTAAAAGAVFWAFRYRRESDPILLMGLFLACTISSVPYFMAYDTLALTLAALLLLDQRLLDPSGRRMVLLVYWLTVAQMAFGNWHIPGPALIAPAFAIYVLTRLRASSSSPRAIEAMSITAR
jgi:hypothetical protein